MEAFCFYNQHRHGHRLVESSGTAASRVQILDAFLHIGLVFMGMSVDHKIFFLQIFWNVFFIVDHIKAFAKKRKRKLFRQFFGPFLIIIPPDHIQGRIDPADFFQNPGGIDVSAMNDCVAGL